MDAIRPHQALLILACTSAPVTAQLLQSASRGYPTGDQVLEDAYRPENVAAADLDGDGDLDLVLAHAGNIVSPKVSVMRNLGDGSFAAPETYAAPGQTMEVALGDFDQDGDVDAAFAQSNNGSAGNRVLVYENAGDGSLSPYVSYTVGTGPIGLIAADVDLDGDLDLVSANNFWQQEDVSVLYNDGSGSFATRVDFAIPGANPIKLAAGDLNGDGAPELVVSLEDGDPAFAVLTNDGAGGFGAPALTSVDDATYYPTDVAIADVDQDGDGDVLYGTSGWYATDKSTGFALYRNAGDGSLGAMESIGVGPDFGVIYDFAVADVTRDGWVDVLGTARTSTEDGFVLVAGDGSGGFEPAVTYRSGEQARAVTTGDVDGDGDPDAIVVNHASLTVKVFENDGLGFPKSSLFELGALPGDAAVGDIDQDGDLDAVIGDYDGFWVLENQGDSTFEYAQLPLVGAKQHTKLRDLNGDGAPDLLFGAVSLALNLGDGTFGPIVSFPVPGAAGEVDTLDLDGDGDLDVAVSGGALGDDGFFVLENDGSGDFGPAEFVSAPGVSNPTHLETGDFDGDGDADVVLAVWGGTWFWPGDGDGGFGAPTLRDFGEGGTAHVTSADFDGDGLRDIAGADWGTQEEGETLTIVYGTPDGSFTEPVTYLAMFSQWYGGVAGLDVADMDGDGDPDLVAGCIRAEDVAVFLNNGDRTFAPQQRYGVDGDVQAVAAGDFDGDGRGDVIVNLVRSYLEFESITVLFSTGIAPYTDLGHGLAGSAGTPSLVGLGTPAKAAPIGFGLTGAASTSAALLVLSPNQVGLALLGGTLVPAPDVLIGFVTSEAGGYELLASWPSGTPAGTSFYVQVWIIDPPAPNGVAASNAVEATQQP